MLVLCLDVHCSEAERQTGKWWNGAKLEEGISVVTTIFPACTACTVMNCYEQGFLVITADRAAKLLFWVF